MTPAVVRRRKAKLFQVHTQEHRHCRTNHMTKSIISQRIISQRIISQRIISQRIISQRIISQRIISQRIISQRIISQRIDCYLLLNPIITGSRKRIFSKGGLSTAKKCEQKRAKFDIPPNLAIMLKNGRWRLLQLNKNKTQYLTVTKSDSS